MGDQKEAEVDFYLKKNNDFLLCFQIGASFLSQHSLTKEYGRSPKRNNTRENILRKDSPSLPPNGSIATN